MKKLILSLTAVVALALGANAQTEKGKFILGGTASYESYKSDADGAKASHDLNVVPNVGYFVSDNFALGTGVGYSLYKKNYASNSGQDQSFVVSPFGRYYIGLGEQFKFFGQAAVPMEFGTLKSTDADGKVGSKTGSSSSVGVEVSPGFAFFPTKKIGIELAFRGIGYYNYTSKDANGNKVKGNGSESFAVGTNFFNPQIGVQFHF